MSENVIAFAPRPVEASVLDCVELYFNNATRSIQLVAFGENGERVSFTYELVAVSPPDFDLGRLDRSWEVWRRESSIVS